jgi:hypothetical protein
MECKDYKDLIIGYSSGDLPASDRESVEAHVRECETCRLYLAQSDRVWSLLDDWRGIEPRSDFVSGFWERVSEEERKSSRGFFSPFKKPRLNWALTGALASVLILGILTFVLFKPDSGFRIYAEKDARDEQILLELDSATSRETAEALSIYGPWENRVEIMKINGYGDMN